MTVPSSSSQMQNKLIKLQCEGIVPVILKRLHSLVALQTVSGFDTQLEAFLDMWTPVLPQYIKYFTDTWIGTFPSASWADYSNWIENSASGIFKFFFLQSIHTNFPYTNSECCRDFIFHIRQGIFIRTKHQRPSRFLVRQRLPLII